jgi:hypothetical protein
MTFMTDSILDLAISSSPRSDGGAVLRGVVLRVDELARRDRDGMFALYARYFTHVSQTVFERDLDEKHWVVLLRDDDGTIDGFSTLLRMDVAGRTIFFSGDTIVARHRWGTTDLGRLWLRHVHALASASAREVYWFLISSGFRTYRFLPIFFRDFHPRFDRATPELKSLLDAIAARKFGAAYDAATGIVRLAAPAPLRDGVSDPARRALHDPHVRFFVQANPGHADGDELACLVRVSDDNLTAAGLRMLR